MEVISILSDSEAVTLRDRDGRPRFPVPPYGFLFPKNLIARAEAHLRANGEEGKEQLVLWGGRATRRGTVVLASLLLPETEADWGWVSILPSEQTAIALWLYDHSQLLLVESHTHRGPATRRATEMSETDRSYPASRMDGFLTVIIPSYAARGIRFAEAGVWECRSQEWARLGICQVRSRLKMVTESEARDALLRDK